MRRPVSILVILVILAPALRLTIDRHYCGGRIVDVKIDLGDIRASCGMEHDGMQCFNHATFGVNCCHNEIKTFIVDKYLVTDGLYLEKPYSSFSILYFITPKSLNGGSGKTLCYETDTGPPGIKSEKTDFQSQLCIFRI